MENKKRVAAAIIASGIISALFFAQASIQTAHAQPAITIFDHDGNAAGQLEILCDDSSGTPGQCGKEQDVVIRYHASEGRELEIRDDLDCPACLAGAPKFQGPSGDDFDCNGIDFPVTVPVGSSYDISAKSCGVKLPLEAGPWTFLSDVSGTGQAVVAFFDVSFFVLPESPVGAVALISSSVAILGAFYFKQRRDAVAP